MRLERRTILIAAFARSNRIHADEAALRNCSDLAAPNYMSEVLVADAIAVSVSSLSQRCFAKLAFWLLSIRAQHLGFPQVKPVC
jgi:hypothetical protein